MSLAVKGLSQRQLRVGELVRHELSELLMRGRARDEDVDEKAICIAEVRMSSDLKSALVLVTPLGEVDPLPILEGLKRSAKALRGALAPRLKTKFVPQLRFRLDTRFADDARIDTLLREAGMGDALPRPDEHAPDEQA